MLIVKKHRKVVLRAKAPEQILSVLPKAKKFNFKGRDFVAIPHRLDETRVLRNLGFEVPSPIGFYYDWSGQYEPFAHQRATSEALTLNQRMFVLNQIGTGKTLSVLWAYDYLRMTGQAGKMIIVSPLSTLDRVWADEIFRHFPHLTFSVVHSPSSERRKKLLAQDCDVYIVNHDGVRVIEKNLLLRKDIDVMVVDELAEYRNAKTERWRSLNRVARGMKWLWGLTGSPTPKAPTDAWAQVRLISPDNVPAYFTRFRDMVMRQAGPYRWLERVEAKFVVRDAMQPSILFTRDECLDLPDCTVSTRTVEMSAEQAAAYKDMLNRLRTEYAGGLVTASNEAVKAMKLLQIACGVAYASGGEDVILPTPQRISAVKEIIDSADGKVIIYVPLTGGLNRIADELTKDGYVVATVHGETPKDERSRVFNDFQTDRSLRVLIAHPRCMAHGLTLTAANVIIWYIPTYDYGVYEQACGRIIRQGQKRHQHIIHLEGSSIEKRVYQKLQNKESAQSLLLDLIKQDQEG